VVDAVEQTIHCDTATGFAFERPTVDDLIVCTRRALALYQNPITWRKIQLCAMRRDFGWQDPARAYIALYRALVAGSAIGDPPATERATSEASAPLAAQLEPVAA
jgi:starch synthase